MAAPPDSAAARDVLAAWIRDARGRSLQLIEDLSDRELRVEQLDIVNPLDWEIGHVGHFQERFVLRDLERRPPHFANGDDLFDSILIEHDERWDLRLPTREALETFLLATRDRVLERVPRVETAEDWYRNLLAVLHEDMHGEAFLYTRQTMGYRRPVLAAGGGAVEAAGPCPGDVAVPGGTWVLGAGRDADAGAPWAERDARAVAGSADAASLRAWFAFDNELLGRPTRLEPFRIARAPVTQAEFAAFVEDGGYERDALWSAEGLAWRGVHGARRPLHWRGGPGAWERRDFDRWVALEPHRPVVHVCWHEAQAWCRWAGRRLPTEAEWEAAMLGSPGPCGELASDGRPYPWGRAWPDARRARLDGAGLGCAEVGALAAGDSAFGCRQGLGNVWEWCADTFDALPGFEPGPYREYSEPLFGSTRVLRGGAWPTRSRLVNGRYRNYYGAERRDVWAGFRTVS